MSGPNLLTAGTGTIDLNGFMLEVESSTPGGVGFEVRPGALLHFVGPGTAAFRGGYGVVGTNGEPGTDGAIGAAGVDGTSVTPTGGPGQNAGNGENGTNGADGGLGGAGFVNEGALFATGEAEVSFSGGIGGIGGTGGAGGNGGGGGDGGNGWGDGTDGDPIGAGGQGGNAGDGGNGGYGGSGGNGGDSYLGTGLLSSEVDSRFGSYEMGGGDAGAGGSSGLPGSPGVGGVDELGTQAANGAESTGAPEDGLAGTDGLNGDYGNISPQVGFLNGDLFGYDLMVSVCGVTLNQYMDLLERAGIDFPTRDGYTFAGWALTPEGQFPDDYNPTMSDVAPSSLPICMSADPGMPTFWKTVWMKPSSGGDDEPTSNGDGQPASSADGEPTSSAETLANTGDPISPAMLGVGALLLTAAGALLLAMRRLRQA